MKVSPLLFAHDPREKHLLSKSPKTEETIIHCAEEHSNLCVPTESARNRP